MRLWVRMKERVTFLDHFYVLTFSDVISFYLFMNPIGIISITVKIRKPRPKVFLNLLSFISSNSLTRDMIFTEFFIYGLRCTLS
jgi:hypothetical protein